MITFYLENTYKWIINDVKILVYNNYLLTLGRFKTTSKNFSRTNSKAASVTAGLGSTTSLLPTNTFMPDSFEQIVPFVATLCFFRKAAEKPDAQT